MKNLRRMIFVGALSCFGNVFAQVYNIMDYGAVADTTVLSTQQMQDAIDACALNGGGTVLVPAGDYKITAIRLDNNVELHLNSGARIFASRSVEEYRDKKIPIGATDMSECEVMVYALGANNISITGHGELNARAEREMFRRKPQTAITDSVTGREIANAIAYGADYQSKYRKVPPCPGIINFTDCHNVMLRDFSVIESSAWGVHLQWCENVVADGLYIASARANGVNSDGLDIDGCTDVRVSNCRIDTGDDGICLKTTLMDGKTQPCKDIAITNCIVTSSSAAIKFGTETHDNFENIVVSNCVIKDANRGINMIIQDGGIVRNVIFSDLIINTVRKATFWWGNGDAVWLTAQRRRGSEYSGTIENVIFSNIIAHGQGGVRIEGFHEKISNIRFSNFQMFMEPENAVDKRARNAFLFENVRNLQLIDCSVEWNQQNPEPAWQHAYNFKNIDGLTTVRISGEKSPNGTFEAINMENVTNHNP